MPDGALRGVLSEKTDVTGQSTGALLYLIIRLEWTA